MYRSTTIIHKLFLPLTCLICTFVTEHVMQDSTTTTVKDTPPTVVLATHIVTAVDGGVGEVAVAQCRDIQLAIMLQCIIVANIIII